MPEPHEDPMHDERVLRLKSPEDCEQFALNVGDRLPELALAARRRAITLQAEAHGAVSEAEREALEAVYAYERALSMNHGRKTRASRTWQMIKKHGILATVERAVNRPDDAQGYRALQELDLQELAFEAIVLRHPGAFTREAADRAQQRLQAWSGGEA